MRQRGGYGEGIPGEQGKQIQTPAIFTEPAQPPTCPTSRRIPSKAMRTRRLLQSLILPKILLEPDVPSQWQASVYACACVFIPVFK